jgi:hypothetical protein
MPTTTKEVTVRKSLLFFAAVVLVTAPVTTQATLLGDHFGVQLTTGTVVVGDHTFYDVFIHDWQPTLNTVTADYVADDWYGKDVLSFDPWITLFGGIPSGGEPFDVEAIYLDNDEDSLYLSIVTSFPSAGFTHPAIPDIHVAPGDVAIGIGGGMYDYGIDIDGGTGILHATDPSDWYVWNETYSVPAQGELTNFSGGIPLGAVGLSYEPTGTVENEFDTYLIEATVPLAMIGDPQDGTPVYVHWVCGCRNDASGNNPILKLMGEIDRQPLATEATTWSSMKALFR